jgi:hypothetical protein
MALSQPIYAHGKGGGGKFAGGGGRGGGGGKAHFSAPAAHANFGRANVAHANFGRAMKTPSMPHFATQSRPKFNSPSFVTRSRPTPSLAPSMPRGRTFAQPRRNAPSIAFGGSAMNNNTNAIVNARNARTFAGTNQAAGRGNVQAFRAPTEVSRDWDRGRVHMWNHHHYRWYGNDWAIIDDGAYGYPSDYGNYDQPYLNYPITEPAYDSSLGGSLVSNVQDELSRLGYSPGPVDGVIGPQTQDAIADFQNDRHLPVTGQPDTATLRALGL